MEKIDTTWRIFVGYILVLFFMLLANFTFGQIEIKQFNAGWNSANNVDWVQKLSDCKTMSYIDISKDKEAQKEYKIAVVPTIIIFKDGDEVARFQADLSFKMAATVEELQGIIDETLMESF